MYIGGDCECERVACIEPRWALVAGVSGIPARFKEFDHVDQSYPNPYGSL